MAGGQIARGDQIEVLVVAFDPVEGRVERLVAPRGIGDISDRQPEPNLRVLPHDAVNAGEISVNVTQRAKAH